MEGDEREEEGKIEKKKGKSKRRPKKRKKALGSLLGLFLKPKRASSPRAGSYKFSINKLKICFKCSGVLINDPAGEDKSRRHFVLILITAKTYRVHASAPGEVGCLPLGV